MAGREKPRRYGEELEKGERRGQTGETEGERTDCQRQVGETEKYIHCMH